MTPEQIDQLQINREKLSKALALFAGGVSEEGMKAMDAISDLQVPIVDYVRKTTKVTTIGKLTSHDLRLFAQEEAVLAQEAEVRAMYWRQFQEWLKAEESRLYEGGENA